MEIILENECKFANTTDAIKYGANLLQEQNIVREDYANNLILREEKYPTGIQSVVNFSICHTEPEYSLKSGICVLIMKDSLEFHDMVDKENTIPVKIIYLLASDSATGHMEMLQKVVNIMSNEEISDIIQDKNKIENTIRKEFSED